MYDWVSVDTAYWVDFMYATIPKSIDERNYFYLWSVYGRDQLTAVTFDVVLKQIYSIVPPIVSIMFA